MAARAGHFFLAIAALVWIVDAAATEGETVGVSLHDTFEDDAVALLQVRHFHVQRSSPEDEDESGSQERPPGMVERDLTDSGDLYMHSAVTNDAAEFGSDIRQKIAGIDAATQRVFADMASRGAGTPGTVQPEDREIWTTGRSYAHSGHGAIREMAASDIGVNALEASAEDFTTLPKRRSHPVIREPIHPFLSPGATFTFTMVVVSIPFFFLGTILVSCCCCWSYNMDTPLDIGERDFVAYKLSPGQTQLLHEMGSALMTTHVQLFLLIIVLCIVLIFAASVGLSAALWASFATISFWDAPCDQPLKYFMIVKLSILLINIGLGYFLPDSWYAPYRSCIRKSCACSWYEMLATILNSSVAGFGAYMVFAAKTCQVTNPELFHPIRFMVIESFLETLWWCLTPSVGAVIWRLFLYLEKRRAFNKKFQYTGYGEKISELDQVAPAELKHPRDTCIICMRPLSGNLDIVVKARCQKPGEAAATPCLFHKGCLAQWAERHKRCPSCRSDLRSGLRDGVLSK